MRYLIFLSLFFYLANWRLVHNWFRKEEQSSNVLANKVVDHRIHNFIYKMTGVKLDHVYIAPSKALFAFCGGVTRKPILVISRGAYEKFKENALEWLLLHEVGHYVLGHTMGMVLVETSYAIVGWLILTVIDNTMLLIILSPVLAVLLAIATIQTNKRFDVQANEFAVKKMKHPIGMKEGALLLMQQAQDSGIMHDTILMKLFYPWNYGMWNRTIKDAEKEIKRRTQ